MSKVLVHIHSDLEFKNKVTLGLMVALAAEKSGHEVTLFSLCSVIVSYRKN